MRIAYLLLSTTSALILSGATAMAGGYTAPTTETVIVAPQAEVAAPTGWQGAYAGATLGFSFGGDDELGFDYYEGGVITDRATNITNLKVKGVSGGVRVGYRWVNGSWVFGPELSYEAGSVKDDFRVGDATEYGVITSKVKNMLSAKVVVGRAMDDRTMVYGLAGVTNGKFQYKSEVFDTATDASIGSQAVDYNKTGYVVGLGVERKLTDRLSATAEWNYNHFGRTDVMFGTTADGAETVATPSHHTIKLGMNYQF